MIVIVGSSVRVKDGVPGTQTRAVLRLAHSPTQRVIRLWQQRFRTFESIYFKVVVRRQFVDIIRTKKTELKGLALKMHPFVCLFSKIVVYNNFSKSGLPKLPKLPKIVTFPKV